jgi:calcyphosin
VELQVLMKYYDKNGDNCISYDEFVAGLREPLNERKRNIVLRAFDKIDTQGNGFVTFDDMGNAFDVSKNSDFASGYRSREDIVNEFLASFGAVEGGKVCRDTFVNYYTDVCLSCPSEDYFVRMISAEWGVCEDEDSQVYKETLAEFISKIRLRVLEMSNNNLEEFVL